MAIFSNDVADKVLRVLQSANRIDQQKLLDARAASNGSSVLVDSEEQFRSAIEKVKPEGKLQLRSGTMLSISQRYKRNIDFKQA